MVEKNDIRSGVYVLECSRPKKKEKNYRKKDPEDMMRPASKTQAQLAFESQERFGRAEKAAKKAQKVAINFKKQAKRLLSRKEKVSQLLEDFSELENGVTEE